MVLFGEGSKPETINYRTQTERWFILQKKFLDQLRIGMLLLGKYKKVRYKGIICDKLWSRGYSAIVRVKEWTY